MKHLITAIFLFIASSVSAQIVNIPDPGFKETLIFWGKDLNGDGEIEVSEALALTKLNLYPFNTPILDLTGIEAFQNLDTLGIAGFTGTNLDLGSMPNLKILGLGNISTMQTANISGCTNLLELTLETIEAPLTSPMNFTFGHLPRLKRINTHYSSFGPMDLRGCDSLHIIRALSDFSFASPLNISGLTQLDSVYNIVTNGLIATNCTGLKLIYSDPVAQPAGAFFEVTGCTNLREINISGAYTTLTNMDLSTCSNLRTLIIHDCAYLNNLNIKTGHYLDSLLLTYSPAIPNIQPLNVCVDDFNVDSVTNMIARSWNAITKTANISPYCSFLPGGLYNTIQGKIKMDWNNNGCDNADAPIVYLPVKITNTYGQTVVQHTSYLGDYTDYRYLDTLTVKPYFPYAYYTMTPASATVRFDTVNNIVTTANFCIAPNGAHNDLEITILPVTEARPGVGAQYKLIYKNKGTTTLSGNVQFNFDNYRMTFNSASPVVSSQNNGQLNWNYTNLGPFEQRTITVTFLLFAPPINNIDDTLFYFANVDPVANDETSYDNSFILAQGVIGSFDPNDKECLQGSKLDIANIGKPLDYIIRFQNLGNDTAFNVVVVDTLSDKLDWNTVEITSTSHPCNIKQTNGILEFFFKDIHLPYQAINDAGSHGFVAFKIKTKNNLVIGDSINNKAAIYFDFNPPVITNIATTIVSPTSAAPVKLEYFSLTTRSGTNLLIWKAPSTSGTTNFGIERSNDGIHYNNFGSITASVDRCRTPFNFTDEKPFDGKTYYRLNIKDADGISFYSKVLVAGRTKSGLSINAVVSNKNNTTVYLNASKAQNLQMKIIAADGRLTYNQSKTIEAGSSALTLPLKNLAKGIYTLIVYTCDGEIITKRFLN